MSPLAQPFGALASTGNVPCLSHFCQSAGDVQADDLSLHRCHNNWYKGCRQRRHRSRSNGDVLASRYWSFVRTAVMPVAFMLGDPTAQQIGVQAMVQSNGSDGDRKSVVSGKSVSVSVTHGGRRILKTKHSTYKMTAVTYVQ